MKYSCLGFPNDWYEADKRLLNNPNFNPYRLSIEISGYKIISGEYEMYEFSELPEDICKKITDVEDQGEHYSKSSRYIYSVKGYKDYKGIEYGTAKAVIQRVIIDNFDINTKFTFEKVE